MIVVEVVPGELLTGAEVARLLEVKPASWRSLVSLGYAPAADEPGTGPANRRKPLWRLETVRGYMLSRPGRGSRTDLHGGRK
jgi:hypothetical protein